jgi:glycosyltransferase domain-containing protein
MASLLAIIIPTKNRLDLCLTQIKYYHNFKGQLIIVDSSSKQNYLKLKKFILSADCNNVKHFHKPNLSVHQAIEFGVNQVKKECDYFVFSGDDDFYVIKALYRAVNFLDLNLNYLGVVGNGISIKLASNEEQKSKFWVRKYWSPRDIDLDDAIQRVNLIIKNYFNLEYSVRRLKPSLKALGSLNQIYGHAKFEYSTDLEICESLSITLLGKIKFIKMPFLIRGDHTGRPNRIINLAEKKTFPEEDRKNRFIKYVATILPNTVAATKKQKMLQAEKIIHSYYSYLIEKEQQLKKTFSLIKFSRKFFKVLLGNFYKFIIYRNVLISLRNLLN